MSETNFENACVIGEKLRAARQQRDMSLRDLAKQANISASMLSQIETGKAYPSVRSIYSIAAALGLPVDYFFPEGNGDGKTPVPDDSAATHQLTASEMREAMMNQAGNVAESVFPGAAVAQILHAESRPTIHLKGGVAWARLTAAAEPGAEFLEIIYACGATSGANLSHHEGREFGLVLEGELVVQLGFNQVTLRAGDTIIFDSTTPHRLANKGDEPMRALWVVWNRGAY
jgi:transcriptional regulator with XRE-family HTH domain/mannose-6-phosphate isomerase-like protein (cupin superfamily)